MNIFLDSLVSFAISIIPWVLFGIIISYFLDQYLHPSIYEKFSGKPGIIKITVAQILGMISPLSIMSFLPIARELTEKGVNPSLLLSFFLAERAYDAQSLFIISGLFGIKFALLNALAIFLSLLFTAIHLKEDTVNFRRKKKKSENFWYRQGKLLSVVILGILLGAIIKVIVPADFVQHIAGTPIGGYVTSLFIGFSIYVGPVVGNYPIAKAFSDLGMSQLGVFTFLTVSPICNIVVISLFGAAVGFKKIYKAIFLYMLSSMVLSLVFSFFL